MTFNYEPVCDESHRRKGIKLQRYATVYGSRFRRYRVLDSVNGISVAMFSWIYQ